jgi:predicted house-cleaning noncanonical NTP pyrophosphatase (MazG superfamily)
VYRLASVRVGVPEYRNLVERKLNTARELYEFMVDQFNEARAFVLELAIAILALLDVLLLLRGR